MAKQPPVKQKRAQTEHEEFYNTLTHALGALLSIVGFVLLLLYNTHNTFLGWFSVSIYGVSLIVLFTASSLYHSVKNEKKKHLFRVFDHISIYLLIAGTYTPICLLMLQDSMGWHLFIAEWGIVLFGVFLKLFFTGRFGFFSILLYLFMGWLIVLDFSAFSNRINPVGLWLLYGGGISFTVGIVFYATHKIIYNHVIWHLFVLLGAVLHYAMVFLYVINFGC